MRELDQIIKYLQMKHHQDPWEAIIDELEWRSTEDAIRICRACALLLRWEARR